MLASSYNVVLYKRSVTCPSVHCRVQCIMQGQCASLETQIRARAPHIQCSAFLQASTVCYQKHIYMQGEPFDWHSHIHRTLDGQLLAVLDSIHSCGICHRDLHQGNILVTSCKQIVVLDFAGANLESTAEERMAERNHMAMLLSLKASCHATYEHKGHLIAV